MKVILLKDVAGVGVKNQVKDLSNGYAQNFLINRGLAEPATPEKIQKAEKLVADRIAKQAAAKEALENGLKKLKGAGLTIRATANEKNHLFEALGADTIAAHLQDVVGVSVDEDTIIIDKPIKELGAHTVHVGIGTVKVPVEIIVESK